MAKVRLMGTGGYCKYSESQAGLDMNEAVAKGEFVGKQLVVWAKVGGVYKGVELVWVGVGAGGEVTNRTQNMMPCTCYFTSLSQRATTQY